MFGKSKINDFVDPLMLHYVIGFYISMNYLMLVKFLSSKVLTAIPLMICLKMSTAYFSENGLLRFLYLNLFSSSASVRPSQYSMTSIFKSSFSKISKHFSRFMLSHCCISLGSDKISLSLIYLILRFC